MPEAWPSGLTKVDLLTLSDRDRKTIRDSLAYTRAHTKRTQIECMRKREYAFKNNQSMEAHWKAQHEAYQRGINRLTRLIEIFT